MNDCGAPEGAPFQVDAKLGGAQWRRGGAPEGAAFQVGVELGVVHGFILARLKARPFKLELKAVIKIGFHLGRKCNHSRAFPHPKGHGPSIEFVGNCLVLLGFYAAFVPFTHLILLLLPIAVPLLADL